MNNLKLCSYPEIIIPPIPLIGDFLPSIIFIPILTAHEEGNKFTAIEIKSGLSVHQDFFKNLLYYQRLSEVSNKELVLVYGGTESYQRNQARVISWKDLHMITKG